MNLNKLNQAENNEKPFHSNGYAIVANGNNIGSVNNISFERRLNIDRNRQKIGPYRRSIVGSQYSSLRAKQSENSNKVNATQSKSLESRSALNRRFVEPARRNYNPFA